MLRAYYRSHPHTSSLQSSMVRLDCPVRSSTIFVLEYPYCTYLAPDIHRSCRRISEARSHFHHCRQRRIAQRRLEQERLLERGAMLIGTRVHASWLLKRRKYQIVEDNGIVPRTVGAMRRCGTGDLMRARTARELGLDSLRSRAAGLLSMFKSRQCCQGLACDVAGLIC